MFDTEWLCNGAGTHIGPDDPALPNALTTGIKRMYHGLIPGGGYNSDAAITAWCESPCISGAVHSEGNDCDSAQCCHGNDCDNMTLAGCQSQGGTWYPDHDCTGVDPCTDPTGPAIDCCGQCGCYRCHSTACNMSMSSCKSRCKGACFDPGNIPACPTGHNNIPRVHYYEDDGTFSGPWLDITTHFHQVGYAVSWGLGVPITTGCPAPDWMSVCGWDAYSAIGWCLTPSGHGASGSSLLCQWVGYHCQEIIDRRPKILRIDWTP